MTFLRWNDGLVGKFKKPGHLLTFHDIQTWQSELEEAAMSGFGAARLFREVFSITNCRVAPWIGHQLSRCSMVLLDLAASGGYVVLHRYYGREVFYQVASGKCQCPCPAGMTQCSLTEERVGDYSNVIETRQGR